VRLWHSQTTLRQAINQIKPTRKGYINTLAEESFKAIQTYDLKLPANSTKPSSYKKASNQPLPQWFRAEAKDRDGFLEFDTWERINQTEVTDANNPPENSSMPSPIRYQTRRHSEE
jgi:hypothetical protein